MSQRPAMDPANAVGQAHQFGAASESVFRRLYAAFRGRDELIDAWSGQQEQLTLQAERNAALRRNQRRLQRALGDSAGEIARLHGVLGSVSEGIILQDLQGKVTLMNAAAQTMLGGKKAFWDSELGTLFERYRGMSGSGADLAPLGESAEIKLNGRTLRAQLAAIGGAEGERIGTVILLRDVTYDALAQRLKDGFVAAIAREMESPLAVIKLAGELLEGDRADGAVNRRLLGKLLGNAAQLDQLGLELLDIAAMEAGSFDVKREPVAIEALLWDVARGMEAELRSLGIDLLVMTRRLQGAQVHGDAARLGWALAHLLRNGALYNQRGGYVAIAAQRQAIGDEARIAIRVSDNGSGIDARDLPHIFERLYRGGNARGVAGLGQGLTVARAICEAHRGDLQAQSRRHIGSAFTMRLPLRD